MQVFAHCVRDPINMSRCTCLLCRSMHGCVCTCCLFFNVSACMLVFAQCVREPAIVSVHVRCFLYACVSACSCVSSSLSYFGMRVLVWYQHSVSVTSTVKSRLVNCF
jgi:hypothetical protein